MHHQTKSSFSILQNYTSCLLPISNFNVKDWISLPLSLRKHPVPVAGRLGLFCVVFNLHHRPDWTSSHQRNTPLSMPVPRRLWLSRKAHLNVAGTIPWGPKLDLKGRSGASTPLLPPDCRSTVISSLVYPLPWWTDRTLMGGKWSPFLTGLLSETPWSSNMPTTD